MQLLDEILKWSEEKLPLWQQDALRRLFQQGGDLSEDDYSELYGMLRAAHGLHCDEVVEPDPLSAGHLPSTLAEGEEVVITAIRDLEYVNKIAPNQKLELSPSGMTVIYGGNGSGKSGYARVLKRACRARDQSEKILTDATDPDSSDKTPKATFDIDHNRESKSVFWENESESPCELATITTFDSHCAKAYLTAEQNVEYIPYGLDILENLAKKVIPELSNRLAVEIANLPTDKQPFEHLKGETEVGKVVTELSHESDVNKIKSLSIFKDEHKKRIEQIDRALNEVNPEKKIQEIKLTIGRLENTKATIDEEVKILGKKVLEESKRDDEAAVKSETSMKEAAKALRADDNLLPGTGGETWKAMFEAARKYSLEDAYPGKTFPNTDVDSVCPLCQQTLGSSIDRIKRFEAFVQNDIAKQAQKHKAAVEKKLGDLSSLSVGQWLNDATAKELDHFHPGLSDSCKEFISGINSVKDWIISNFTTHSWDNQPELSDDPRPIIDSIIKKQNLHKNTLQKAIDQEARKALDDERLELKACESLSSCSGAMISLISNLQTKEKLENCKQDLQTTAISRKSTQLASKYISDALKSALDEELNALGIKHIKTKYLVRNDHGTLLRKLILDIPTPNKLVDILSEGEQRSIALASFFAELTMANHSGGIVFDDPVSSLDHVRRSKVANRLALESLNRQVIVFTHEVVFLDHLQEECKKLSAHLNLAYLEYLDSHAGHIQEGLPWDHKTYRDRLDKLGKTQRQFVREQWPPYPNEDQKTRMLQAYSFLRATIERVVQDFVLNGTVKRFSGYIKINNLDKVVGLTQNEVDEILKLTKRCHELTEAHDPASARNESPPTPEEFKQDIDDLEAIIEMIRVRRSN